MEKPTPQGDIIISYPGYKPMLIRGFVEVTPVAEQDNSDSPED